MPVIDSCHVMACFVMSHPHIIIGIAVPIEQPQSSSSNRKRTSGGGVGGQSKKQKKVRK